MTDFDLACPPLSGPPILARIAGLPVSTMEDLGDGELERMLDFRRDLEERLSELRSELVDELYDQVGRSGEELRGFLLEVKRDSYNGRPLAGHRKSDSWSRIEEAGRRLGDAVVELEERLEALDLRIDQRVVASLERERQHLRQLLDRSAFVRGVSLASPVLANHLYRLRRGDTDRKGRKAEESLLRYASRAALKLSPYSTLTRVGLGELTGADAGGPVVDDRGGGPRLVNGDWEERGDLRVRRHLLDQIAEGLLHYPPFGDRIPVVLNDTLEEPEPGRFRFLRPGAWVADAEADDGRLKYRSPSLVSVRLPAALMERLAGELGEVPRPWIELREEMAGNGGGAAETLDTLLSIGVLVRRPPWPVHVGRLEDHLLAAVRERIGELGGDPVLEAVRDGLEGFRRVADHLERAEQPGRLMKSLERHQKKIWSALAPAAGLAEDFEVPLPVNGLAFEDVVLEPSGSDPADAWPAVVEMPRERAEELLGQLDPLVRISALFSGRLDFLLNLQALAGRRWPGRNQVGLLELLAETGDLWRAYRRHVRQERGTAENGPPSTFDPQGLPELGRLDELRRELHGALDDCVGPGGSEDGWGFEARVDPEALERLASKVPEVYRFPVGPSLFLQAADRDGRRWVLNRLYEGTGRYSSRFTPVLSRPVRRRYAEYLRRRSMVEHLGERWQLLDLMCAQGDTLNVHAPQTQRVLTVMQDWADVPRERNVDLRQLTVRFDGDLPRVVDAATGDPYLPVHLGVAAMRWMPVWLKFLAPFGPEELLAVLPPRPARRLHGGGASLERLRLGDVILKRTRWVVPRQGWMERAGDLSDSELLRRIHSWRRERGIPRRTFLIEAVHHELAGRVFKPQYMDFGSPLFLSVLRTALKDGQEQLVCEEMVPAPEAAPRDDRGRGWALELLIDSITLAPTLAMGAETRHRERGQSPGLAPYPSSAAGVSEQAGMVVGDSRG